MTDFKYFLLILAILRTMASGYIGIQADNQAIGVYLDTELIINDIKGVINGIY
jgi:hypothetical protein